ncbi:hypothetical protein L21SP5_03170 [Salinivirga cyanobacteriivorans]|uniref:Uncharacterized protein n=1 Tax=Salinivirga cyanobacteriivorans TaxID=1307839 RepID=A0A0S2I389_9BACT|nr:hypothetical protein [Salinivirga cyanobacteriivorans]ALO16785.1 hypothetical protein L21SP5_03170 [Salinivirga cyanobacteriivorans]
MIFAIVVSLLFIIVSFLIHEKIGIIAIVITIVAWLLMGLISLLIDPSPLCEFWRKRKWPYL